MNYLAFDVLAGEYNSFVVGKDGYGLYQTAEKPVSWVEACKLAHLDFTVRKSQLIHPFTTKPIEAWGIFRDDTDDFIGTVGSVYKPLQFQEAFQFVDHIMGEAGGSHYEAAGALGNGNKYWVLARVPRADFSITGTIDKTECYLLLYSSHDGTTSTIAKLTGVRAISNTTLSLSLGHGRGNMVKVKHTKGAIERLNAAKRWIQGVVYDAAELQFKMNTLASRLMTEDSFTEIINRLFPGEINEGSPLAEKIARIHEIYRSNDGNAVPEIKDSAYALLNAVSSYTDHERSTRETRKKKGMSATMLRAESAVFGSGNDFKNRAFNIIYEETTSNPTNPNIPEPSQG